MKKLLVLTLLFLGAVVADAQSVRASFGAKGVGLGIQPQTEIAPIGGMQIGGGGGAFFGLKFFNTIGIQAEGLYTKSSAAYEINTFGNQTWVTNQTYIMVPVVMQLWLGRAFALEAGYQQAIAWGGTLTCVKASSSSAVGSSRYDNGMLDYGSLVAGVTLNMGKAAFLNFRYTSALEYSYVMTDEPSMNTGFQVGLGLRFFNSKKSVFE